MNRKISDNPNITLSGAINRVENMAQGFYFMEKLEKGKRLSAWEIKYHGKRFINRMRKYYKSLTTHPR